MRISDIKNAILDGLRPFADIHGFKVNKGRFALVSKEQNPTSSIFFTYNSWGFEINLFPYVSVDFKEISDICKKCGFNLNHAAFVNLFVLARILKTGWHPDLKWKMQVEQTDRLLITDDMDWCDYCKERIIELMPTALEYIRRFSTIESIDRLYNDLLINRYNPYCSGLDTHCIIGTIAAKLSHNPMYEQIKGSYIEIVRTEDFTDAMKDSYFKIVDSLDSQCDKTIIVQ